MVTVLSVLARFGIDPTSPEHLAAVERANAAVPSTRPATKATAVAGAGYQQASTQAAVDPARGDVRRGVTDASAQLSTSTTMWTCEASTEVRVSAQVTLLLLP